MRIDRIIIAFIILSAGCKPAQVTTSTVSAPYKEDLSVHRMTLEATLDEVKNEDPKKINPSPAPLTGHIKAEMDSVNILIAQRNKSLGYIEGFTIQVYTGLDRQKADEALELALSLETELSPEITYRQPSYKVKVGHYTSRLEAHEVFQAIKKYFPNALMIPERKAR